jgi:hypothetical protein
MHVKIVVNPKINHVFSTLTFRSPDLLNVYKS